MDRVPIQLGTLHIREAMQLATREEMENVLPAWKTANFPPHIINNGLPVKEPEFDLNKIKGHVKLTKSVTVAPFQTVHVSGLTECDQHFKRVNVIVEPDPDKDYESVIPMYGYTVFKPGSSRVSIGLRNHSCQKITVQAKSVIAKIVVANVVPHSLAPNLDNEEMLRQFTQYQGQSQSDESFDPSMSKMKEPPKLTPKKEKLLFSKIDLTGADDWDPELMEETRKLFHEYAHIFALESLDIGHTSMVKYKIRLDN